jgi:BirA family biotin operon repressor/biotin-[acetyl-CoA-carboxylase] ligase
VFIDERVRAELAASTRFKDVRFMDVVDSTNRVVSKLADAGEPEGLVVAADLQTAGRGRLDRSWDAEPGSGLLVSLLLRPAELPVARWHLLTAATAVAARSACAQVAGVTPDIKWPNDLLLGERKLAGILAEGSANAMVIGMGLNVHSGPPGSAHLDGTAERRVSRTSLLVAWLAALDGLLGRWEAVTDRYRAECSTIGREVVVEKVGGARLPGRAERIDEHGRLVVRGGDGELTTVSVGDVTHLRAPTP